MDGNPGHLCPNPTTGQILLRAKEKESVHIDSRGACSDSGGAQGKDDVFCGV